MSTSLSIREQFRRNAVALTSVAIAVAGLGYNTWRNETTEYNRNQRLVSLEILDKLGDLQHTMLEARYGKDEASLRKGWALTLTIKDIAMVAEGNIPNSANALYDTWADSSDELLTSADAKKRIDDAVTAVREDTHTILRNLE